MLVLLESIIVDHDAYDNASSWKTILTENIMEGEEPQQTVLGPLTL